MALNAKKREIIFAVIGILILLILLIAVFFTMTFSKNIFKAMEGKNNIESPITRFNFEKLKNIGIIKE